MILPATIVCTLLGLILFDVPGALLGLLGGVLLDRHLGIADWRSLWQRLRGRTGAGKIPVATVHFMLLGYLAKLNGRVLPVHIRQASAEMDLLRLSPYARQAAVNAFNQGKAMQLQELRNCIDNAVIISDKAELLIASSWRLAWAERKVSQAQRQAIFSCGKWMGLLAGRVAALELQAKPAASTSGSGKHSNDLAAALAILGLTAGVRDWAVIQRSYRRLLSENHPDKLIGQGASAQQIEQANNKTRQLHTAYRLLRQRLRG